MQLDHVHGPGLASASASGTCTDKAGNTSVATSFPFKFDDTLPSVSATPARGPTTAAGTTTPSESPGAGPTTSGIDSPSCTAVTYSAPDVANRSTGGSCSDNAGNTRQVAFPLSYDSTAPTGVSASAGRPTDFGGWFNATVGIGWSGSDATSGTASAFDYLQRTRLRERKRKRDVRRQRGEHFGRQELLVQLRRHASDGHGRGEPLAGRQRLVQPAGRDQLERH